MRRVRNIWRLPKRFHALSKKQEEIKEHIRVVERRTSDSSLRKMFALEMAELQEPPDLPSNIPTARLNKQKKNKRVLLADNFHVNRRNFASVFTALDSESFSYEVGIPKDSSIYSIIFAAGCYSDHRHTLAKQISYVQSLTKNDVLNLKYKNVYVWPIAMDEALCLLLGTDRWQKEKMEKKSEHIFEKMWEVDRQTLIENCAACLYWLDYWASYEEINKFDVAVVFSGSFIYARTLLEILKHTRVRSFVVESFMTGNEFYFEERNTPIANNSRVQHNTYINRYKSMKCESDSWEKDVVRAFNKINNSNNKNVKQPPSEPLPRRFKDKEIILVLGQVVNDFSLISGSGSILNSIPVYKNFISRALRDENKAVIFKSHPWEANKKNISTAYTFNSISEWGNTLENSIKRRLMVVDQWNLQQLIDASSYVVTICSQSSIEAAMSGLKPIVIGGSFYSNSGFTTNFDSERDAADAILTGTVQSSMNLEEYSNFKEFITVLLQGHLFTPDSVGIRKINEILRSYTAEQQQHSAGRRELNVQPSWSPEGAPK